jgi:hypothetical protein
MSDDPLTLEAQALTARLYRAWDATEHDTLYATRLVALAERAHRRHIRRAARHGDPLCQHWLALLASAATNAAETRHA